MRSHLVKGRSRIVVTIRKVLIYLLNVLHRPLRGDTDDAVCRLLELRIETSSVGSSP